MQGQFSDLYPQTPDSASHYHLCKVQTSRVNKCSLCEVLRFALSILLLSRREACVRFLKSG